MAILEDMEDLDNLEFEENSKVDKEVEFTKQEKLGTNIYSNKERSIETLLPYISGMKWKVDYYNQMLNKNSKSSTLSSGMKTLQQYRRIKDAVLYLQSALDTNTDLNSLTLEFVINMGIIPNKDDLVVANLFGGRTAMFKVERVEKRNYQDHNVYYGSLKFYLLKRSNEEKFKDLETKITEHLVYDPNYIRTFGAPILQEKDYIDLSNLKKLKSKLVNFYFSNFVDKDFRILNPFNSYLTKFKAVDPYLNKFITSTIEVDEDNNFINTNMLLNVTIPKYTYTILDAILKRDSEYLDNLTDTNLGFSSPSVYKGYNTAADLTYLKLNGIVNTKNDLSILTDKLLRVDTQYTPLRDKLNDLTPYIFTSNFYNNEPELMLPIELLIVDYLLGEIIDPSKIYNLVKDYTKWSRYEQYYLIPIFIRILKTLTIQSYSSR